MSIILFILFFVLMSAGILYATMMLAFTFKWLSLPVFKSKGKKLYVVGGAVRDFLTGDKPKDFDLATDALPDEVLEILGSKYKTNLQGKAFGVVVVFTDDQPEGMEIATFREDVSKGRNPEVKLGVTIEDDVKRRDLTYNALFYDLDTKELVYQTYKKDFELFGYNK